MTEVQTTEITVFGREVWSDLTQTVFLVYIDRVKVPEELQICTISFIKFNYTNSLKRKLDSYVEN